MKGRSTKALEVDKGPRGGHAIPDDSWVRSRYEGLLHGYPILDAVHPLLVSISRNMAQASDRRGVFRCGQIDLQHSESLHHRI